MEKQRKSGGNEMQLKTGREAWKNSKTGILAISWQSVRNHCEFRNQLANSSQSQLALRNSLTTFTVHCELRFSHKNFKSLAKFRIANFANHIANFATTLPTSQTHCQIRNPLPTSQTTLPTSQHHCQLRNTLPNSLI